MIRTGTGRAGVCWHLVVKARDLLNTRAQTAPAKEVPAPGAVALMPRSPGRRPSRERDLGVWAVAGLGPRA